MSLRPRPVKVTDDELIALILRNQEEVTVGPSTRELAEACGLSHTAVVKRIEHLEKQGLAAKAYRGLKLTDAGADRVLQSVPEE